MCPLPAVNPEIRARMSQVVVWNDAVQLQAYRVLSDEPWPISSSAAHQADAYLFALALRNLLRAASFVHAKTRGKVRALVDAAIAELVAAIPDAVNVRDVLEHFDAYKAGKGNLQKGTRAAGRPSVLWHERHGDTHVVAVALVGRQVLRLDIAAAQAAASALLQRLDQALARGLDE